MRVLRGGSELVESESWGLSLNLFGLALVKLGGFGDLTNAVIRGWFERERVPLLPDFLVGTFFSDLGFE